MRFVVLASLLGFLTAAAGLAFFGMGWLTALAIWLGAGPAGAVLALTLAMMPSAPRAEGSAASVAEQAA